MNVVFDVGNVIVRWSPAEIIRAAFEGDGLSDQDIDDRAQNFFGHELWRRLNRGHFTEAEALAHYVSELGMSAAQVETVFHHVKVTQIALPGTIEIIERLYSAGYPLFALTDNVREIVAYLRERYDFWRYFRGVVVSAECDVLKPDQAIYRRLLTDYGLEAHRTVFFDDMPGNVAGAQAAGMHAFRFVDAAQCERDLVQLGLRF
jgi:putative hydrolase of the HAD superfamily